MLLKHGEVNRPVKAGKNLAELRQAGISRIETSGGGQKDVPYFTGVYMIGLPYGNAVPEIKAPIDLEAGDIVHIAADGYKVYEIHRDGKEIWRNAELHADEDERAAEVQDRIAIRKANRR